MMKHIVAILFFVLGTAGLLRAQDPSGEAARAAILEFSARVSVIDCDFVQTKESSLLAEKAVSTGHMTYRKPGHLEWTYRTPSQITFVANGGNVTIRRDGREETLAGNQNRMVREMTRMIISNIEGSVLADGSMFKAEYEMVDGNLVATLYPQKKDLRKMWSKFVLYYDRETKGARRFEMHEASGDLTVITFSGIKYEFSE